MRAGFSGSIVLMALLFAAPQAADARRVALVVGISDYAYSPTLPNPKRDAERMSAALRGLNFEVITSLDNDLAGLIASLEQFYKAADGAEAALFFYAGHGLQLEGVNYLVPKDAQLRSEARVRQETIALQTIISATENRAKITLVFLDACRDNPLAEQLQRSVAGKSRSASVSRGLAPMEIRNPDTLVIFAAAPGKTAADGVGQNSPFTQALLSNIGAPGKDIELVMKHVTKAVAEATRGEQVPERLSKLTSDFFLNETGRAIDTGRAITPAPRPAAVVRVNTPAESAGCIPVGSRLTRPVPVRAGSALCAESGGGRALVRKVSSRALVYAVNGVETACKTGDLCQFNWPGAPLFRVQIERGPDGDEVLGAQLVPGKNE
jgi:hypothetical protein